MVSDNLRQKWLSRLKELKKDIYVELLINEYPVVKEFVEDPRPFSVASFGGYLKLVRANANIPEKVKERILELQSIYENILTEKVRNLGYRVEVDDEGYTYLVGNGKHIKLGFNDIMNIYGGKNLEEIIDVIIKKAEGRYHGIKYRDIPETPPEPLREELDTVRDIVKSLNINALLVRLGNNPSPLDWATLAEFYGLVYDVMDLVLKREERARLIAQVRRLNDILNERLDGKARIALSNGGFYLVSQDEQNAIRLRFSDVLKLLVSKDVGKIVNSMLSNDIQPEGKEKIQKSPLKGG